MEVSRVITNASNQLTKFLQDVLKQTMEIEAEHIGLSTPGENHNLAVCVYLYDIKKNTDMIFRKMIPIDAKTSRYPSTYYDLHYMIVPYSKSDIRYKASEEQRYLDVMIQALGDAFWLEDGFTKEDLITEHSATKLELLDMDYEEKAKIWSSLNQAFKLSLFCKVGPVEVSSARSKKVERVEEIQISFVNRERKE